MNRVKRTGTRRPAQPPSYFGPALCVTASVLSTRKFQKHSGVFPEIYINSVTSERQSIKRLSLRSAYYIAIRHRPETSGNCLTFNGSLIL